VGLVELQFLPYDWVGYGYNERVFSFDPDGIAMLGIGCADDLLPVFANAVFEGFDADFVAVEDLVEDASHFSNFASDGAIVLGNPAQIGYQVFGSSGELVGLFRHSPGLDRGRGEIVEWIAVIGKPSQVELIRPKSAGLIGAARKRRDTSPGASDGSSISSRRRTSLGSPQVACRRAFDFKGKFIFLGIVVAVVIASCISGFETQPSVKLNCFKRYLF
jgi:hypothetical protein